LTQNVGPLLDTSSDKPLTDKQLRSLYRKLRHRARTQEDISLFNAACAALTERGYRLNSRQTDWIFSPKGE
jgi:hypothetical protein